MRLIIPFSLPGLNEYIEAERGHRQKGAKLKRDCQTSVILALRRQIRTPLREPVVMHYLWVEKDRRRDKDNISSFGRKVIQDALVKMGALKNAGHQRGGEANPSIPVFRHWRLGSCGGNGWI